MIIAGLTGAFLVNYWLAHNAGHSTEIFWLGYPAWRWMFWAQVIPAGLYLILLLLIPDSPRCLLIKGRVAEADGVLSRILGAGAEIGSASCRESICRYVYISFVAVPFTKQTADNLNHID